jgi:hypothetical protein
MNDWTLLLLVLLLRPVSNIIRYVIKSIPRFVLLSTTCNDIVYLAKEYSSRILDLFQFFFFCAA